MLEDWSKQTMQMGHEINIVELDANLTPAKCKIIYNYTRSLLISKIFQEKSEIHIYREFQEKSSIWGIF